MSSNTSKNNSEELDLNLIIDKIKGMYHSGLISCTGFLTFSLNHGLYFLF